MTFLFQKKRCLAPLTRAISDQMYVDTDNREPYTVGDTQSSLLRIVSLVDTNYRFGANSASLCTDLRFTRALSHFHKLFIDIRDQHARSILFKYETLTVILHFKRNR